MGRKKIAIKKIADASNRKVTFNKRRDGVIKKAVELSVLCDCDVAVVIYNKDLTTFYEYASSSLRDILEKRAQVEKMEPENLQKQTNDDIGWTCKKCNSKNLTDRGICEWCKASNPNKSLFFDNKTSTQVLVKSTQTPNFTNKGNSVTLQRKRRHEEANNESKWSAGIPKKEPIANDTEKNSRMIKIERDVHDQMRLKSGQPNSNSSSTSSSSAPRKKPKISTNANTTVTDAGTIAGTMTNTMIDHMTGPMTGSMTGPMTGPMTGTMASNVAGTCVNLSTMAATDAGTGPTTVTAKFSGTLQSNGSKRPPVHPGFSIAALPQMPTLLPQLSTEHLQQAQELLQLDMPQNHFNLMESSSSNGSLLRLSTLSEQSIKFETIPVGSSVAQDVSKNPPYVPNPIKPPLRNSRFRDRINKNLIIEIPKNKRWPMGTVAPFAGAKSEPECTPPYQTPKTIHAYHNMFGPSSGGAPRMPVGLPSCLISPPTTAGGKRPHSAFRPISPSPWPSFESPKLTLQED